MTELKDMDNGIVITPFVSLKEKQEVTVKRRLLKKYDSIIGTLYEETENDEKE